MTGPSPVAAPPAPQQKARPDPRSLIWWTVVAGLFLAIILACSGLLATLAFDQYSQTKWVVSVVGPVLVLLLVTARKPVTLLAGAVVVALPFGAVQVSVRGVFVPALAVLLVVGVIIAYLSTHRGEVRTGRPGPNRIGLAAVAAAALLLPAAVRGLDPGLWFVQVAAVAATGYIISRACHLDPAGDRFVLAAFAGSVGVQGLLAVREFQTGRPFSAYGGSTAYGTNYFFGFEGVIRPSGSFYDPISLGNVLALAVPILVVMACRRGLPPLLRLWFALCCLSTAAGLVLTLSRMSWVGAVAGVAVVLVLTRGTDRLRQLVFLAAGAFVVAGTAVALAGPSLVLRFNSIFNPTATGVSTAAGDQTRQQLWAASYDVFADHPFFGVGLGGLHAFLVQRVGGAGLFGHAHSTYLQNLAEGGILGGLAIAVLGYAAVREIARRLPASRFDDPVARACAGALVTLAVVWTTDYTVRYTAVLTCMALPFIFLLATRGSATEPSEGVSR